MTFRFLDPHSVLFGKSKFGVAKVCGNQFGVELGEVSFYGHRRYCVRPQNF